MHSFVQLHLLVSHVATLHQRFWSRQPCSHEWSHVLFSNVQVKFPGEGTPGLAAVLLLLDDEPEGLVAAVHLEEEASSQAASASL